MISTIIRDSPVLAGAIAILVAILLFLIIAITTARRATRPDPPRQSYRRREPDFDDDAFDVEDFDRDYGRRRDIPDRRPERRGGRYGFGGLTVSFLLGLTIGLGGLAAAPHVHVAPLLSALLGLVEAGSSTAREPETTSASSKPAAPEAAAEAPEAATETPKAESEPPAVAAAEAPAAAAPTAPEKRQRVREVNAGEASTERDQRLASFMTRMQAELPKQVGTATTLTNVELVGTTITLGYSIDRLLTDAEVAELKTSLSSGVTKTLCSGKSGEARYLNDNGVVFRLIYFDQVGKTLAKLTAQPHFCDSAG